MMSRIQTWLSENKAARLLSQRTRRGDADAETYDLLPGRAEEDQGPGASVQFRRLLALQAFPNWKNDRRPCPKGRNGSMHARSIDLADILGKSSVAVIVITKLGPIAPILQVRRSW
ncbi:hypothetical protein MAPG_09888 [Magnaporthiopsis poae ATCC 64411]|uniref:Uncharacterized protein n=1 Tax=Magnaporthiopsis poae (strain ATCC 64411 / 73-15) TaxID=644358 RepID=A0A0C4EB43_MAGP6|nr:hypothetical protein MAPG_09888 [Magnaporthiopsis poae ATCC 64411]